MSCRCLIVWWRLRRRLRRRTTVCRLGRWVFAPGETSKTITMTTVDDELDESPEKVTVLLGSGSNYTVSGHGGFGRGVDQRQRQWR